MAKYVQTETTFNTTKKAADELYMETVTPAWTEYTKQMRDWTTILFAAIRMANDPGFALSTLFSLGLAALEGSFLGVMLGQGCENSGNSSGFSGFPAEWLELIKPDVSNMSLRTIVPVFDHNVNRCHEVVSNPYSDWDGSNPPRPLPEVLPADVVYGPELPPKDYGDILYETKLLYDTLVNSGVNKAWARSQTYYKNLPPDIRFISKETNGLRWGKPWEADEVEKIHTAMIIIIRHVNGALDNIDYMKATLTEDEYKIVEKELNNYQKVLLGVKAITEGRHTIFLQQRDFKWYSDPICWFYDVKGLNYNLDRLGPYIGTVGSLVEINTRKGSSWKDLKDIELAELLFHEFSHDFGTKDTDRKGYFMNAYKIADKVAVPKPNLYFNYFFKMIFTDLGLEPPDNR